MHLHHRCRTAVAAALLLLAVSFVATAPAMAQQAPAPQATPAGPFGMSIPEWLGVFYYSDVLAVAATGATNPLLLIPLLATGFLGGCSVGANAAPGLVWLFGR